MQLPRLTAKDATEARAQLRQRRAILLQAAADMLDRAELFIGAADGVYDELIAESRALLAQADRCAL